MMAGQKQRMREYDQHAARILRAAACLLSNKFDDPQSAIFEAARGAAGQWTGSDPAPTRGVLAGYAVVRLQAEVGPLRRWACRSTIGEIAATMMELSRDEKPASDS